METQEFENLKEQIRLSILIEQIIGEYVPLNQKHIGRCPFHDETTPSFSVNIREQYFHCFGCGVGGDVFRFIKLKEKKSFMEAMRLLADKAGIALPQYTHNHQEHQERCIIESILNQTAQFYHNSLTDAAKEYLIQQRKFTDEIIKEFKIGFALGGLREYLINQKGFSPELCLKTGVLKKNDEGQIQDFIYQRIIFPTLVRGTVVHLSGRSFGEHKPKYLHLPGQIKHLYNESDLFEKEVILAEGVPDCLTLVQHKLPAVGVLGAGGFKPEYANKFNRCQKVYICFDPDKAGLNGALKTAEILGEKAVLVQMPPGMDINNYFKEHDLEDFRVFLQESQTLIEYRIKQIPKDIKKTDLPQVIDPILQMLAKLDRAKAEAYLSYTIKPYFDLKPKDMDAYRALLRQIRQDAPESSDDSDGDVESVYTAKSYRTSSILRSITTTPSS